MVTPAMLEQVLPGVSTVNRAGPATTTAAGSAIGFVAVDGGAGATEPVRCATSGCTVEPTQRTKPKGRNETSSWERIRARLTSFWKSGLLIYSYVSLRLLAKQW